MLRLLSSPPSPVEKEKQNYEATAPGNPRFLEQLCFRRIMGDVQKTLMSSGVDNSMAKKKKILMKTFWFSAEEIQTVFNRDRTRFNIFIIISLLLLFYSILLARSLG